MLHFPQRSIAQIKRKVLSGMAALQSTTLPPEMGRHWREQYVLYQNGGQDALRRMLAQHLALCLTEQESE